MESDSRGALDSGPRDGHHASPWQPPQASPSAGACYGGQNVPLTFSDHHTGPLLAHQFPTKEGNLQKDGASLSISQLQSGTGRSLFSVSFAFEIPYCKRVLKVPMP